MITTIHNKLNLVLVHPIFQKFVHQSKNLNKILHFTFYLKTEALKLKFSFYVNCDTMNNSNKLYIRIRSEVIHPKLVYLYIERQFNKNNIPSMEGYLLTNAILNYVITNSGYMMTLSAICEIVDDKSHANFSIGRYPQNFGDMEFFTEDYITVKR